MCEYIIKTKKKNRIYHVQCKKILVFFQTLIYKEQIKFQQNPISRKIL